MTSSIHESSTEKGRIIDNKNVDSGQLEDGVRETTKQLEITPELARIERLAHLGSPLSFYTQIRTKG